MLAVSPQCLNKILKMEKYVYFDILVEKGALELGRLGRISRYEPIKHNGKYQSNLPNSAVPHVAQLCRALSPYLGLGRNVLSLSPMWKGRGDKKGELHLSEC